MSNAASTARASPAIAVIGAGIIGSIAAYVLCKRGAHVTLIDRGDPGRGCSYGNAGALSPGWVAPMAMPGMLARIPRMLLDPEGPMHVPLAYLPRAAPWLSRFVACSRGDRVESIAARLYAMQANAVEHHVALAKEVGASDLIKRRGQLHVYPDAAALARDASSWGLIERSGIRIERVDRAAIEALEPRIAARYQAGMYVPDHAMIINPFRYVQQIVRSFIVRGGRLARDEVRGIEPDLARGWSVHLSDGRQNADHVVVAAGMHSSALLEPLGVRLPIESQRGYHVTFPGVAAPVERVVTLGDRGVTVSPLENGFRVAGTVEFGGLARPANPRRFGVLAKLVRETFTDLPATLPEKHWMGHRPCTPDSLPLVGPVASRAGLWLATGHGHLGLTGAVNTAVALANAILEGPPPIAEADDKRVREDSEEKRVRRPGG
ncbi:MAG TPA: FAD-dependent oxidoreductase [Casimicrobiaceae bacterium]|nr:FAD-dependent oxidoreductase [Casimicrobiaceae bacterium]